MPTNYIPPLGGSPVFCPYKPSSSELPPLNAMTDLGLNNCIGNGSTDDRAHIIAGMDAAVAQGKRLFFPTGTYLISSFITLSSTYNNLYMYGDGATSSVFKMANPDPAIMFHCTGSTGNTWRNLGFTTSAVSNGVYAININGGCQNWTLDNLKFTNMRFGIKIGGTTVQSSAWTVSNIDMDNCRTGLYVQDLSYSTFTNLDIDGGGHTGTGDHPLYVNVDNHYNTYSNLTLTNAGGFCLHLNGDGGTVSTHQDFDTVTMISDTTDYSHCFTVDGYFSDCNLTNLTFTHRDNLDAPIVWYDGATNIIIDGFTATNDQTTAPPLQTKGVGTVCYDCELKNGTYATPNDGTWPGVGEVDGVEVTLVVQG